MKKDFEYLDPLAGEVYGFMYDRLIHNMPRKAAEERLKLQIQKLNEEEKSYIKTLVSKAFEELIKSKNINKK